MQIDQAKLDEASRMFRAMFVNTELGDGNRWWQQATEVVPVKGKELKPKFASREYGVHEWLDQRQYSQLRNYDFSLIIKDWANGLAVKYSDLEDDMENLELYRGEIEDMRDDFEEDKHEKVVTLLENGFDATIGTVYDGQYLFDSDHPAAGGGVQSNVGAAALATDGVAFRNARAAHQNLRKPNGKLAGIRTTHIVVPTALESVAEALFLNPDLSGGGKNPLYNAVKVVVEPRLTSATAWFLMDLSKRRKPFLMGDRSPVKFRSAMRLEDPAMMDQNVAKFGGDARYEAGYNLWQLVWGSTGGG